MKASAGRGSRARKLARNPDSRSNPDILKGSLISELGCAKL